jgi:hypothetical protein
MTFATKRDVDDRAHNISKVVGLALFVSMIFVSVGLFYASTKVPGLPASPSQTVPATFFGMHMHYLVVPSATGIVTPWPDSQVREWRLWDAYTMWPYLEPSKGQWTFQTLDKSVQLAEEHDARVILTLGLTPAWASARPNEPSTYRPGWAAEPKDIEDWRNFVRTVASRYRGRIHVYEVGNEPNLRIFWTGSTEQMIELTREAHDIIKSIDPTALIVSPSATGSNGLGWLAEFLSKGGGQYVDIIGYHLYVFPKPPEAMVPLAQEVKRVMVQHGVGNKPLWDTESGWLKPTELPSEELQAGYLARAYILAWSQGVERFYWYAWDDHNAATLQLTTANNENRTEAGHAFFVVQEWLVGSRMDWCNEGTDHTWTCQLNHDGNPRWIAWNPDQNKMINVPSAWKIKHAVPLLGNARAFEGNSLEVGPVPVLLRDY